MQKYVCDKKICDILKCTQAESGEYYCGDCPVGDDIIFFLEAKGFIIADVSNLQIEELVDLSGTVKHHAKVTATFSTIDTVNTNVNGVVDSLILAIIDSIPFIQANIWSLSNNCQDVLAMIDGTGISAFTKGMGANAEDEPTNSYAVYDVLAFTTSGLFGDKIAFRFDTNIENNVATEIRFSDYGPNILKDGDYASTFMFSLSEAQNMVNGLNDLLLHHLGSYGARTDNYPEDAHFQAKANLVNPTKVVPVYSVSVMKRNPDYSYWHWRSWWNHEDKYHRKYLPELHTIYRIATNMEFPWDQPNHHKYFRSLFDVLNVNRNILVEYRDDNWKVPGKGGATLWQRKGYTHKNSSRGFICLPQRMNNSGLAEFDYEFDDSSFDYFWHRATTFLHEALAHIHYAGGDESSWPLQEHFYLRKSATDHGGSPMMNWSQEERSRLQNLIKETGKNN